MCHRQRSRLEATFNPEWGAKLRLAAHGGNRVSAIIPLGPGAIASFLELAKLPASPSQEKRRREDVLSASAKR